MKILGICAWLPFATLAFGQSSPSLSVSLGPLVEFAPIDWLVSVKAAGERL